MWSKLSTESLARASAERPKRTIALWLAVLVAAFGLFGLYFDSAVTTEFTFLNDPDSKRAEKLLEERLQGPDSIREVVVVRSADLTVDEPAYQLYVENLYQDIEALGSEVVPRVTSYYENGDESLVSTDRQDTILPLVVAGDLKRAEDNVEKVHSILDQANGADGFEVFITGEATFSLDFTEGAQKDAETGESFGIPIALIILAVVFGALAASGLPVMLAIGSIVIALGAASVIGQGFELHVFVQNVVTMIGLAVGIDYSLFVVSRFREERSKGLPKIEAIAAAGRTASRTVLFSGMTVVLSLVGLLIIPPSIFVSVGLGAILVVTAAVLASLTLLPAVLSIMGDRVNKFRIPLVGRGPSPGNQQSGGFWDRVTSAVMRRPAISLVLAGGLLIAAAVPYFSIHTGDSGVSTFPDDFRAKQGFLALQEEFGFGLNAPAEVVIDGRIETSEVQEGIRRLQATLSSDSAFGSPELEVNEAGDLALITAPLVGDATSEATIGSVRRLRDTYVPEAFQGVPVDEFVGGFTADSIDFIDTSQDYLPIVIAFVLGLSFILLTIVFRSIVIPVKAIIMNLLSLGAAYGLLVLVFQKGVGNELFGFSEAEVIQAWIPVFLFAILFGLSMDYHVFLLSRIQERFRQTRDNSESVAYGLRSTTGLITGAALIMVAVFAGFAAGDLVQLQQFGFGMAVAILLDATIVRTILVPASMKLLGDKNWYLPNFLKWLPDVRVEAGEPTPSPARVPEPAGADDD